MALLGRPRRLAAVAVELPTTDPAVVFFTLAAGPVPIRSLAAQMVVFPLVACAVEMHKLAAAALVSRLTAWAAAIRPPQEVMMVRRRVALLVGKVSRVAYPPRPIRASAVCKRAHSVWRPTTARASSSLWLAFLLIPPWPRSSPGTLRHCAPCYLT